MMRCLVLAAIAIGWAGSVSAQEQGQLGESSTGKITVSVDIEKRAPMISITELEAVNFDKTDGDQALEDQTISACIYIDQDVLYDVTVVANPLTSGSESYAYDLEVSQSGTSIPNTNALNISSSTDTMTLTGLDAATEQDCTKIGPRLDLVFKDAGTDQVTAPFSASAIVEITVMPQ